MSALFIFDKAPIGTIVSWTDGRPRPREDLLRAARAEWIRNNATGRLVRKRSDFVMGQSGVPASIKVATDGVDDLGAVIGPDFRTFPVDAILSFTIIERPAACSYRILDGSGEDAELLHLAPSRSHAESWVRNCGFRAPVIVEVTADEVAADHVEGRAA